MKFIVEDDLRDLYKKEPFTTYEVDSETKLTPGARQFLVDRGIDIRGTNFSHIKKQVSKNSAVATMDRKRKWKTKKLYSKMKSTEAVFLLTAEEIIPRDIFLAKEIIYLGKQITGIINALEGKGLAEIVYCKKCNGIKEGYFCFDMGDCFEITESHMQLVKYKEILLLNRLCCILREIEPVVMEVYEDIAGEKVLAERIISQVNQIINYLSQLICIAIGGKECMKIEQTMGEGREV